MNTHAALIPIHWLSEKSRHTVHEAMREPLAAFYHALAKVTNAIPRADTRPHHTGQVVEALMGRVEDLTSCKSEQPGQVSSPPFTNPHVSLFNPFCCICQRCNESTNK